MKQTSPIGWRQRLCKWLSTEPRQQHVWKEIRRETIGSFIDYGVCPQDITTMYRVAVFEQCLIDGETRIREIRSLFPQDREFRPS